MENIYLTFDDGPNEPYTSQILDFLKEKRVRATFFVCGKCVERYPEVAKRIAQEGHAIGNHTYSHSKIKAFSGLWGDEIEKTSEIIEKATGVRTYLFRPPWGRLTSSLERDLAEKGYKIILWDFEVHDWEKPAAELIADRVIRGTNPNFIILLHDGYNATQGEDRSQTVRALPLIINALSSKGYLFDTIK